MIKAEMARLNLGQIGENISVGYLDDPILHVLGMDELTDTYSPAAIDMAPATSPATPATTTLPREDSAAATPTNRLAMETIPSLAPMTAARSLPIRSVRCSSLCRTSFSLTAAYVHRGRDVILQLRHNLVDDSLL